MLLSDLKSAMNVSEKVFIMKHVFSPRGKRCKRIMLTFSGCLISRETKLLYP
jgi:hypothetical protein